MKLIINKTEYDNRSPYEKGDEIGNTYKLLNKHLMELGYGAFNCNDLFAFWKEISDKYCASWLCVPEDINIFKQMIDYEEEDSIGKE